MKFLILLILSSVTAPSAILMDGSFDFLQRTDRDGLSFTNAITISIWASKSADLGSSAELFTKGRVNDGTKALYHIRNNSGQWQFYFAAPDNTFHLFTTTGTFTETNVLHHLVYVGVYGNSNISTFFVDGSPVSGAWTANPVNIAALNNTEPNRIGVDGGVGNFWSGSVAEISLWSTNLSTNTIKMLYQAKVKYLPVQIQPQALVFYLPIDEGHDYTPRLNGLPCIDRSKNYNAFTPSGSSPDTGIEYTERRHSYQPNE